MASSYSKLDQALQDLIETYTDLEAEVSDKHSQDEDSYNHAIVEVLETSIESALEEHDVTTSTFASLLSNLMEALEQLDPLAFEDDSDSDDYDLDSVDVGEDENYEDEDEDIDLD